MAAFLTPIFRLSCQRQVNSSMRQESRRQPRALSTTTAIERPQGRFRSCKMCAESDDSSAIERPPRNSIPLPALMFVLPPNSIYNMNSTEAMIADAVAGGVNIIQVRESIESYSELDTCVANLVKKFPDVLILVNSNIGTAVSVDRSGLHLPELFIKFHSLAREKTTTTKVIGSSVHSVSTAENAVGGGSDYLVVGTTFETESHPGKDLEGILMLKMVRRAIGTDVPLIAIGGIKPKDVAEVMEAGAAGVAVMTGISQAADPKAAAAEYKAALEDCWRARQEQS